MLMQTNHSWLGEFARSHSAAGARSHTAAMLLLLTALPFFCTSAAHAQSFQDLHDFAVPAGTPAYPWLMTEGRDNNIYGVTATGGTNQKGTIFKIGPSGGFTVLYNFDGAHGATPVGGLTLGADGNLYGMAEREAANGFGNIFRITPNGTFTVLYDFKGGADGGLPVSPLIIGADGKFYGTSYKSGGGAAFRLTPAGALTVISEIPTFSYGPLLQAKDGSFYGVTEFGGTHGGGTVYKIARGNYTILHHFDEATGAFPIGGLVEGSDGNFYGTTTAGGSTNGGVVYSISPAGSYHVVVDWDSVHDLNGYQAFAGLIAGADGKLYGATIWGGQNGFGVIFSLTTDGAYSVLYDFARPQGDGAYATPFQHSNGMLYGITNRGGAGHDGVLYRFDGNLGPFAKLVTGAGTVGGKVGILGSGFSQATGVAFNGKSANFHVASDTFLTATVPAGQTGLVTVELPAGSLVSDRIFRVTPELTSFSPHRGRVGATVTLHGDGLIQAAQVTVGGVAVVSYTVNNDSKLTIKVPPGARSGRIIVRTPGGKATSSSAFNVMP